MPPNSVWRQANQICKNFHKSLQRYEKCGQSSMAPGPAAEEADVLRDDAVCISAVSAVALCLRSGVQTPGDTETCQEQQATELRRKQLPFATPQRKGRPGGRRSWARGNHVTARREGVQDAEQTPSHSQKGQYCPLALTGRLKSCLGLSIGLALPLLIIRCCKVEMAKTNELLISRKQGWLYL